MSRYTELAEKATPAKTSSAAWDELIADAKHHVTEYGYADIQNDTGVDWGAMLDEYRALRNAAPDIERLWKAADAMCDMLFLEGKSGSPILVDAVEKLRDLFGEEPS